jgi:catechol 2,3-dioxygenase-like lactoylglutathione lyase family enzyme
MRWLRGLGIFVAGLLAGILLTQPSAAPQGKAAGLRLNHFGVYVKDFNQSVDFYQKTMGFPEAFSFKDKDGKPLITYLQIDRDTFVELQPADAEHPVGFSHVGIWTDDLDKTVAALRAKGVKMDDVAVRLSKAPLTNLMDPNGARIELLEYPPESLQRKAMNNWK